MIDVFLEESVGPDDSTKAGRKYKRTLILSRMFLFSGIIFTLFVYLLFITPFSNIGATQYFLGVILPGLIMCVLCYVMYAYLRIKKHNFLVDYDYTFITGELRIAKVLNGLKRRPVAKIQCSDISVYGKMSSEKYLRYKTMPGIKIIVATPNVESKPDSVDFMVCMYNGNKSIILFQPSTQMVYNIKRFAGRTVEYA